MTKTALFFSPSIKIKHCKTSTRRGGRWWLVIMYAITKFIAITKEEGKEEEKKKVVFWSTKSLAKKYPFFVPYVVVCFDPIAANGIDVIHGCGGQQGGDVGKPRKCEKFCPRNPFWPKFANTSLNLPLDDGKLGTTFETGGKWLMKQKKLPITF